MSDDESVVLARLLRKVTFPLAPDVFNAWCENFVTNPIELGIVRTGVGTSEILLIHRKDRFFDGWHVPGSVILPGRTVLGVLRSLITREVGPVENPEPIFIWWMEFMQGPGPGQCARGQELSLLFRMSVLPTFEPQHGHFFPFDALPANMLEHHVTLIAAIRESFEQQ